MTMMFRAIRPRGPGLPALLLSTAILLAPVHSAAADDAGFFFSAKIGTADIEQSFGDAVEQLIDGEEDSLAFEAGFLFFKYFGVQAGYHDFGDVPGIACVGGCDGLGADAILEASTKAYSAAAVGQIPLPLGFSIFGKAGVVFWESEVDLIGEGQNEFLEDFSDEDVILGAGVRWRLPGPFSIFGEWEEIAGDIETFSLGATLSF